MHSVTDEQIDFILSDIAKKGVETEDVRYNILDHVCCIIENEMPAGENFYEFYKNTIARFYKKELREIEDETRELITFKYYYAMKRTLKITGAITIVLCLLGALFKFQHWPGAGILLLSSLAFFALVFIPLNIIMKFRDEKDKINKLLATFGFVLGMGITIGMLFKIFHWPMANILMFGSLAIFSLIYIPLYFFTRIRNPETKFNAIVNTTFMVAGAGLLFGMINLKNSAAYEETIDAMELYQEYNAANIKDSNTKLYEGMDTNTAEIEKMKQITADLSATIEGIRANLISKSEGISFDKAKDISVTEVRKPKDFKVVAMHFNESKDEYSYTALENAIANYNAAISQMADDQVVREIQLDQLKMEHTTLSVILNELVDIEIQALSNENSFLCLQKGLLATK